MKTIDISTLGQGLYSEKVIIDPSADSFAIAPPVNDDKYVLLLTKPLGDTPFVQYQEAKRKDDGSIQQAFFKVTVGYHIESFLNPQADNSTLKGRKLNIDGPDFSTFVVTKEGKPASSAATLLRYLGLDIPVGEDGRTTIDIEQLANAVVLQVQSGSARVWGRTIWRGGWKKGSGVRGATDQYGRWNIMGQNNFPLMLDGKTRNPIVIVDGEEKRASAHVTEIGSLRPAAAAR